MSEELRFNTEHLDPVGLPDYELVMRKNRKKLLISEIKMETMEPNEFGSVLLSKGII